MTKISAIHVIFVTIYYRTSSVFLIKNDIEVEQRNNIPHNRKRRDENISFTVVAAQQIFSSLLFFSLSLFFSVSFAHIINVDIVECTAKQREKRTNL